MPLPFWLATVQAAFLQWLPTPPLTVDQVRLLETDNVVSEAATTHAAARWKASALPSPSPSKRWCPTIWSVPPARPVLGS